MLMTKVFPSTWMFASRSSTSEFLPAGPRLSFAHLLMSDEEDVFSQDRCVLVVREVCFPLCSIPVRLFWDIWMYNKEGAAISQWFFGGILMSCEEDVFSQGRCVLVVREDLCKGV